LDKEAGANKKGGGSGFKGYQGSGKFVPHYPLYSLLPPVPSHCIIVCKRKSTNRQEPTKKEGDLGLKGIREVGSLYPTIPSTPFFPLSPLIT